MAKTVLVTGAHGFLGRHVASQLAGDGWTVVGLGHGEWLSEQDHTQWGISAWHCGDVTVASLLACGVVPDAIVHCAGSGSVAYSIDSPYQDFQRTVTTTLEVLEFVRRHAPEARVVYPSSVSVYGAVKQLPIDESAELQPVSPYGVHKLMAEELCRSYSRTYHLSTAIVRFFSLYGAGLRKQLLWDACQKTLHGEAGFFGTGEESRDWLHISDAANLLVMAITHASMESPVVNGGTGAGVTVREILQELFRCLGQTGGPTFNGLVRSGDPAHYISDIARARAWGWQPQVNWRDGMREYADWFRSVAS